MLHLHPVCPLTETKLIELYFLEAIMKLEITKYKSIARKITIQTPPYICQELFYGSFGSWFLKGSNIEPCIEFVQKMAPSVMQYGLTKFGSASILGNISVHAVAEAFCRNYTFLVMHQK